MRSIERYLLTWIIGALMVGSVLVAIITYFVTLQELNEVFDANLKTVAEAMARYPHDATSLREAPAAQTVQRIGRPKSLEIVTLTWNKSGRRLYASDPRVQVPFSDVEGLSRPKVQGEKWLVHTSIGPTEIAQAAQRRSVRKGLAGEAAAKAIPPMLFLVVVVGGLLVFGLRRGLQPIGKTAHTVAARSGKSLEPIAIHNVPKEITPLVLSINALMGRLETAMGEQRKFLADAAHELRTPVTALRLQLQLLKRSHDEPTRLAALAELERGVARSQRLVEQLMQLGRSDVGGELTRVEPMHLGHLVRTVVGAMSVKAEHLGIDLGASVSTEISVHGDESQLTVLLNNLVENALRYTPAGGLVDVEVRLLGGRPMLRVVDNGPGIPKSEHDRVFERFFRGDGARAMANDQGGVGLGLAIARAIAERHRAEVSLHTPAHGAGLEVRVVFMDAGALPSPVAG